ncbi:hypothetical protein MRX96_051894 [Rhipicephalus microplus]
MDLLVEYLNHALVVPLAMAINESSTGCLKQHKAPHSNLGSCARTAVVRRYLIDRSHLRLKRCGSRWYNEVKFCCFNDCSTNSLHMFSGKMLVNSECLDSLSSGARIWAP